MQRPLRLASTLLVALAATLGAAPAAAQSTPPVPPVPTPTAVPRLDLTFAPNAGRYPAAVAFYTHALGGTVQFGSLGSTIILPPPQAPDQHHGRDPYVVRAPLPQRLGLQFLGADPAALIAPDSETAGTLTVAVAGRAATALPTVSGITYQQIYPGIDLHYTGTNGDLKSTFMLAPQTNPDLLRWQYTGAASVTIAPDSGDLLLTLPRPAGLPVAIPATVIREYAPIAWQEINGARTAVAVRFVLRDATTVGFALDRYDPTQPLIIDPDVTVTRLAGVQSRALAVDAAGRAYLAGSSYDGGFDLALTVVDSDGTTVLAQAILAGAGDEQASGAALDASGALWVSGYTTSPALSLSSGARGFRSQVCAEANGTVYYCSDGILVRYMLEPAGTGWALHQQWGSYLGDAGGSGLTIRSDGVLVIAGAVSTDSLTSSALLTALRWDAATARLTLVYQQTLAGMSSASLYALVAGSNGEVYLAGESRIPLDDAAGSGGQWRAWVARLDASGAVLRQVYLGSGGNQKANAIARDAQGNIYLAGNNEDVDAFPALAPLADGYQGGGGESFLIGFVAQLSATLDVRYASQIAGASAYALAVDSTGIVSVPTYRNYPNGVVVTVAPNGAGWGPEIALGDGLPGASAAATDAADTLYLAGYGAFARIGAPAPPPPTPQPPAPQPPAYTKSYYIQTVDPKVSRYMGCVARQRGEQGIVVLFFGRPIKRGVEYGSSLIQNSDEKDPDAPPVADFVSIDSISTTVRAFADGYNRSELCQREFKLEISDSGLNMQKLVIAVATTNSSLNNERDPNPDLTFEHGRAWAQMVLDLNTYTIQSRYKGVKVTGAYDAEPRWTKVNGTERTLAWARGFASLDHLVAEGQVESRGLVYYNMGSMDGGIRDSSWRGQPNPNFDFIYKLSKGIPVAQALPQIYYAAYAKEWYQLRRYSMTKRDDPDYNGPLELAGVLTQIGSSGGKFNDRPWQEVALDLVNLDGTLANLTPTQGWQAMYDALHRTLLIRATLKAQLGAPLPDSLLLPPQAEEDFVPQNPPTCKLDYIKYNYPNSQGRVEPNNRISAASCLGAGTIFPADSTFSQKFVLPANVLTVYNQATRQSLPWATDIGWGRTSIP